MCLCLELVTGIGIDTEAQTQKQLPALTCRSGGFVFLGAPTQPEPIFFSGHDKYLQ